MTVSNPDEPKEVNVGGRTNARKCASSLRERMRDGYTNIRLCAVGLAATMQAVKATLELNKMLAGSGKSVSIVPYMEDRQVRHKTADHETTVMIMRLIVHES